MLVVESLYGAWNIVVRANPFLHILTIVDVTFFDLVVLLFVASRGKVKSKDRLRLLKLEVDWSLEILDSQFFFVLFGRFGILFILVFAFGL